MRRRRRLSWRLGAVVLTVVVVVILSAGYLGSLVSRQFALDAARDAIHFNSASIRSGIDNPPEGPRKVEASAHTHRRELDCPRKAIADPPGAGSGDSKHSKPGGHAPKTERAYYQHPR